MQERVRIGVVGAGRWGRNLIRAFGGLQHCAVTAICDPDEARLAAAVAPVPALRCGDLSDLLEKTAVDAVAIATPPELHAAQALLALGAGKHVFVEKPMALSLRDAYRMRVAAARAGRRLMVGHLLRYHPAVLELRALIEAGVLGEVGRIVALRLGPPGSRNIECPWWSLAPHDVSLVSYLLNTDVVEVSASRRDFSDAGRQVTAQLRLPNGSAMLVVSTAYHEKVRRLLVVGTKQSALFDDGGARPTLKLLPPEDVTTLPTDSSPKRIAEWELAECKFSTPTQTPGSTRVLFPRGEPLVQEAAHFVSAVLHASHHVATDADEGCRVMAVLEAGSTSMSTGGAWTRIAGFPRAPHRREPDYPG